MSYQPRCAVCNRLDGEGHENYCTVGEFQQQCSRERLAAKTEAKEEVRVFFCQTCHDTGEIDVMTQGLGPDDYTEKIACPDCGDL